MSILYNDTPISKVRYNDTDLSSLTYNGVEVLLHEDIDRTQYCYFQQLNSLPAQET